MCSWMWKNTTWRFDRLYRGNARGRFPGFLLEVEITMKKLLPIILLLLALLAGCGTDEPLLYVSFDEGSGTAASGGEVSYLLTNPIYNTPQDPQWRETGVEGGSLLFDGCSNVVTFDPEQIGVQGDSFSVSVWVAPRAFEWDPPEAASAGNEHLTAIVSQYDRKEKAGFLLGYQRFGRLCFQVGTGDSWLKVWADDARLSKYEWNHVAAVFDGKGGSIKLYLNGEVVGERSITPGTAIAPAEDEKLLVGKNSHGESIAAGSWQMFSGLMDELKLYDRVLTAEELAPGEAPEIAWADISQQNVLTEDIYKTQYHGGPYQHWMNEPHAPVYYNGMYHLFFQQNIVGTYWRNICWGHLVSEDLVSWRPVKEAITPTENSVVPDGVWSGCAVLDQNGVPLLFFTAGNDSFKKERMVSNQNIGVAYPADLSDPELIDWVIYPELAVEQQGGQGRAGEFRDPHIWREGDSWFMVICTGSTKTTSGAAILYETKNLELLPDGTIDMDWVCKGIVYEMENPEIKYGTSWELPILLPVTNEAETMEKYVFIFSPAPAGIGDNKIYYFLGEFDSENGRFTPDADFPEPRLLDYGSNVFTGPSAFQHEGNTYIFSIMQDQRSGAEEGAAGWAHCVGLTRRIWLNEEGTDLKMEPVEALKDLEGEPIASGTDLTLEQANGLLEGAAADLYVLRLAVDVSEAEEFAVTVKTAGNRDGAVLRWTEGSISANYRNKGSAAGTGFVSGALELEGELLELEIYVDRSLVEAFFNDTKAISLRDYSDSASRGIILEAEGSVRIAELYLAPMSSIYME